MRSTVMNLFFSMLILAVIGCSETIKGHLELGDNENSLAIQRGGSEDPILLKEGRVTAHITVDSFFTNGEIELEQQNLVVKIKLPTNSGLESAEVFSLKGEQMGQIFDLKGGRLIDESSRVEEEREKIESCKYYGYCYSCKPLQTGEMDCRYRYSHDCDGQRRALHKVTSYNEQFQMQFLHVDNGKPLATFKSDPKKTTHSKLIEFLEDCR